MRRGRARYLFPACIARGGERRGGSLPHQMSVRVLGCRLEPRRSVLAVVILWFQLFTLCLCRFSIENGGFVAVE